MVVETVQVAFLGDLIVSHILLKSLPHPSPSNALSSYPLVKMEIGSSSQISTTAPIFSWYDYFTQTIWRLSSVQFHF